MKIDPNSPAFPQSVNVSTQPGHYTSVTAHPGIPIRLHLAAMAMQAMNTNPYYDNHTFQGVSAAALQQADALIAECNKEEPKP